MHCNPTLDRENHYIIVVVDYFTKWTKTMPTFSNDSDTIHSQVFLEGDLVLVYDQDPSTLRIRKFEPLWYAPYIIKSFLIKAAYMLIDMEGDKLKKPRNGLYLKRYYA
jgi:hypothetical protein